jgi:hypothetical protein
MSNPKTIYISTDDGMVPILDRRAFSRERCSDIQELSNTALDKQVSGDHYKKLKIQPVEYIHANNIPFLEGNVIKYVTRWKDKAGIPDLEKAKHCIELLIELETKNV